MIVKLFTKENGPEMREAKELGSKLELEGYSVEYLDADDEKTSSQMELYDVYSYPTFIIAREDGSEIEKWRGIIPIAGDIKNFLNQ